MGDGIDHSADCVSAGLFTQRETRLATGAKWDLTLTPRAAKWLSNECIFLEKQSVPFFFSSKETRCGGAGRIRQGHPVLVL
jgi:hypothetical protein